MSAEKKTEITNVRVSSLDIPFLDLMWLMVKIGVATLPAVLLVLIAYTAIVALLGSVGSLL